MGDKNLVATLVVCIEYSAGATGPVGPVFTGPLLAPSYTICIRVS